MHILDWYPALWPAAALVFPLEQAVLALTFCFHFVGIRLVLGFEFEALGHWAEEHFAVKVSCHHYSTMGSIKPVRTHLIFTQSL